MHTRDLLLATLIFCAPLAACGEKDDDTGHDDTGHDDTGHDDTGGLEACVFAADQGIVGQVIWREGNWMPGNGSSGTEQALETTVAVFSVLQEADVTRDTSSSDAYGRYDVGKATPVATALSDANGCFVLDVPEGQYTLMADDSGAWFCNSTSSDGLCVTAVPEGTVESNIIVDYMASY